MDHTEIELSDEQYDHLMGAFDIKSHDGWRGVFSTKEMDASMPNGSMIEKSVSYEGDITPEGTKGVVLGSIGNPVIGYGYFVEWEIFPKTAMFVGQEKVKLIKKIHDES